MTSEETGRTDATRAPLIELRAITKEYARGDARVTALAGVDLEVGRGEFLAIMGPSGSGKSTLMNVLGCLDIPSSGSSRLAGREVGGLGERELARVRSEEIGFVFQSFCLLPRATALANVELPLVYRGLSRRARRRLALEALATVDLEDRTGHRPSELSGGQCQRLAIARALVTAPSLLLADEPTGNLDSATTAEIIALVTELHRRGNTAAIVTHEPDIASRAERVVRLRDGRVERDETRGEAREHR